jgi:hypothetical protein
MIRAPIFLLLAISACAPAAEMPRGGAPMTNAECRAEAQADPAVRATAGMSGPLEFGMTPRARIARAEALERAYRDCLRRRGLPAPGGVERLLR